MAASKPTKVAVDLRDKMADRGVLSYEEFLASVFDSMGIPIGNVELISAERTSLSHSDVDGLTSVREITPPVIKLEVETQSSLKECSRDSTPDAVPVVKHPVEVPKRDVNRKGKRQRTVGDQEAVYRKVSFNKLVRTTHAAKAGLYSSASATMFFGSSNDPRELCHSYCKTGACPWKGRCRFVHDPSKVRVCPEWIRGDCRTANCLLQHVRRPELMPHCLNFQDGECRRQNCPYLHTIYNPKAPPCLDFQRSFCPRGLGCWRQHLYESN